MSAYSIQLTGASFSYGKEPALSNVTTSIRPNTITGLLGRNGSGKTTLAMLLAGQLRGNGIAVGPADATKNPWEDAALMANVALVSGDLSTIEDEPMRNTIDLWRVVRPNFDEAYLRELMNRWGLTKPKKRINSLSRGQKSAFFAALGLASRAPLTIFDEVHLGMDAVLRREFYEELLKDFMEHPRTILISSHLVDEIENIIEDVVIIHDGELAFAGPSETVRAQYSTDGKLASLTDVLVAISTKGKLS